MKSIRSFFTFLIVTFLFCASPVWAAVYNVDVAHSSVSFKIRHLFSKVQGQFNQFEGTIEYDPDQPDAWKASGTIQVSSIDTNVPPRDKHLLSKDFFDVENHPTITFKTTKVLESTKEHAKVEGLINVHGVEKPIVLEVDILGVGKDPWGNVRAAFTATTTLNRKDFGLNWNETLETGQLLVGEEVAVTLEIEGILKG